MNNTTIELTPAVLRALAVGIDRLNDSDETDLAIRDEAEATLARAGYCAENGRCYPVADAVHGYVNGEYVYRVRENEWSKPVSPGSVLTLDPEGKVPLRTV